MVVIEYQKSDYESKPQTWEFGGTSHLLPRERAKATFDVETLTNFLDGGKQQTMRRRWIQNSSKDSEALKDMHTVERAELTAKSVKHFIDIHMEHIKRGFRPKADDIAYMSGSAISSSPLMPHYSLFIMTLAGQASPEQAALWLPMAYNLEIIGAYAQTELGHGSNVRGLQTTAEYDPSTQQFVLNTPTLQSMKWWNSNAGLFATHCTMYAQLILNGEEKGVHVFMVQLRDENHNFLPGVKCGDVGNKLGDNAIDTGYIRLNNVRIPREHMLAKRQHVTPDGKYITKTSKKPDSKQNKLHYLTMMGARSGMVQGASDALSIAVTIAIRYSAVRHQGFKEDGSYKGEENPILDYKYQQYRLFTQLSYAYATKITGMWLRQRMAEVSEDIDSEGSDLAEIHASSAGLKGLCTKQAHDGIEDLRKCCGGHGFLSSTGIATLTVDYSWKVTAEGDWVVMLLQTARYLMKSITKARNGEPLSGLCTIYSELRDPRYDPLNTKATKASSWDEFCKLTNLLDIFKTRALIVAVEAERALKEESRRSKSQGEAWNNCAVQLVEAAICHCEYFLADKFLKYIGGCSGKQVETSYFCDGILRIDASCMAVLEKLILMFLLSRISNGINWEGILSRAELNYVKEALNVVMDSIRPNAIALGKQNVYLYDFTAPIVDALDFPDHVLNSTIGASDGNVYERLFESAKNSPLNRNPVPKGYEYVEPYLNKDYLKLHNKAAPELSKL